MYPRTITHYFASIFALGNQEIKLDLSLLNSQHLFGSDEAYSNDKVSQGYYTDATSVFNIIYHLYYDIKLHSKWQHSVSK
jgi:hypothetical protein